MLVLVATALLISAAVGMLLSEIFMQVTYPPAGPPIFVTPLPAPGPTP